MVVLRMSKRLLHQSKLFHNLLAHFMLGFIKRLSGTQTFISRFLFVHQHQTQTFISRFTLFVCAVCTTSLEIQTKVKTLKLS